MLQKLTLYLIIYQKVILVFKIIDNGKETNHNDIINEWLVVVYSAKKEEAEDFDYRYKIQVEIYYVGRKGICGFS